MVFADLKNDFVFRRTFGKHPEILRGLLNDLLDRRGEHAIEETECLPGQTLPVVSSAKLSTLAVRCRDRSDATFVAYINLLHVRGFHSPLVYDACRAEDDLLRAGEPMRPDLVVVSICEFVLWPDAETGAARPPRIPMLSRWNAPEPHRDGRGILQVQHAFLELPKVPEECPHTGAALWAWLFAHAAELAEIPAGIPAGPHRNAMELASPATFTPLELHAYQKVAFEIQQTRDYCEGQDATRRAQGIAEGKAEAILAVLAARGIAVDDHTRTCIRACTDGGTLDRWIARAAVAPSAGDVVAEGGAA